MSPLALPFKLTCEWPLVLSFPGQLSERSLSLKLLLALSAAAQEVNRKNNSADHIKPTKGVRFQIFLPY